MVQLPLVLTMILFTVNAFSPRFIGPWIKFLSSSSDWWKDSAGLPSSLLPSLKKKWMSIACLAFFVRHLLWSLEANDFLDLLGVTKGLLVHPGTRRVDLEGIMLCKMPLTSTETDSESEAETE